MPLPLPPDTSSHGWRTICHMPANSTRGLPGTMTRSRRAGRVVHVEHLLPRLAAVRGAEHAAVGVGRPGVADRGDEDHVGVLRIDHDARDLAGVTEAHELPRLAGIGREVHAAPVDDVVADVALARAHPDEVRVRRRERDRPDRGRRLVVEDRVPGVAPVGGLPHAARRRADVVDLRLAGNAGDRRDSAAADRGPEVAEPDVVQRIRRQRPGRRRRGRAGRCAVRGAAISARARSSRMFIGSFLRRTAGELQQPFPLRGARGYDGQVAASARAPDP